MADLELGERHNALVERVNQGGKMSKEALQSARVRMSIRLRSQGETQAPQAVGAWAYIPEVPEKPSVLGSVKAFLTPSRVWAIVVGTIVTVVVLGLAGVWAQRHPDIVKQLSVELRLGSYEPVKMDLAKPKYVQQEAPQSPSPPAPFDSSHLELLEEKEAASSAEPEPEPLTEQFQQSGLVGEPAAEFPDPPVKQAPVDWFSPFKQSLKRDKSKSAVKKAPEKPRLSSSDSKAKSTTKSSESKSKSSLPPSKRPESRDRKRSSSPSSPSVPSFPLTANI